MHWYVKYVVNEFITQDLQGGPKQAQYWLGLSKCTSKNTTFWSPVA